MKRIALYARFSADKQTCENQLQELRVIAERMNHTIVAEFINNGISV
jgi:DNA invertase Pin-like site-specific DNA recombinase